VLKGSAVTGSVQGVLEGDRFRFQRMPSVDAFNEVPFFSVHVCYQWLLSSKSGIEIGCNFRRPLLGSSFPSPLLSSLFTLPFFGLLLFPKGKFS